MDEPIMKAVKSVLRGVSNFGECQVEYDVDEIFFVKGFTILSLNQLYEIAKLTGGWITVHDDGSIHIDLSDVSEE